MNTITPFRRIWGASNQGPRVLLVHGLSSYSGTWWRIASGLADRGCHVVAPDLRGHGQSPTTTAYLFVEMARDLAELGTSWDLVVGHSLGGPIAVEFALGPGGARQLLLLDPFLDADDDLFDVLVADQLSELDPLASADSIHAIHPDWSTEDCHHKAIGARQTSSYVVERCLRDNTPYHHLPRLAELSMRTRILGSDPLHGALFQPGAERAIDNQLVSYRMLPGVGHSIHRERPALVVEEAVAQVS